MYRRTTSFLSCCSRFAGWFVAADALYTSDVHELAFLVEAHLRDKAILAKLSMEVAAAISTFATTATICAFGAIAHVSFAPRGVVVLTLAISESCYAMRAFLSQEERANWSGAIIILVLWSLYLFGL